jgi:hypothetical protein
MIQGKAEQGSVRVVAQFDKPLLSWNAAQERFLKTVYHNLGQFLRIVPNDLIVTPALSLGDVSVTLKIFSGASSVTMRAQSIVLDFPNVSGDGWGLVDEIISKTKDAFVSEFEEVQISSITAQASAHIALAGAAKYHDVMSAFAAPKFSEAVETSAAASFEPGLRFKLIGADGGWQATITIEKSLLIENGMFILRDLTMSDLERYSGTEAQFALVTGVDASVLRSIGIELQ